MSESEIFRLEALESRQANWHGTIIMSMPISYRFLAIVAAGIAAAIIVLGILGTYTKHATISGQLVPSEGLIKVYAQQGGIVLSQRVTEGQHVSKGDMLFILTSERHSSTVGDTQAAITREVHNRQQSLEEQLAHIRQLETYERVSLDDKLGRLRSELATLEGLIAEQRSRYELSQEDYMRYQAVAEKGYVSTDQLTQRKADVMDQKSRLGNLERDLSSTQRSLVDVQYQLAGLALKYNDQVGDVERNIATANQDLSESEARRELVVVAPADGRAAAITVHTGQLVDTNKPLVSILPEGSVLCAELYAPSRAVGFIKPGDAVNIRYDAFPYQKFGRYYGHVAEIASTTLSSTELTGSTGFSTRGSGDSEPLYRIKVSLETQMINAYGKPRPLQNGMLLEADVMQDTRRLYEWVLEPLYTLSGKI